MKGNKHFPATFGHSQFHCPHCGVYAKQSWSHINAPGDLYTQYTSGKSYVTKKSNIYGLPTSPFKLPDTWTLSICDHCQKVGIWLGERMVYPNKIPVEIPNEDLDEDIKNDYIEAADIWAYSPRAAAALLRLALQKLCKQLGESGENINSDIKNLVKKGLDPSVQEALDSLRIVGNNAVHPGEIRLDEEPERVLRLFRILNFIAEKMITDPKVIHEFYLSLPNNSKEAVKKRDRE